MKVRIYFANDWNRWVIEGGDLDNAFIPNGQKVRVSFNQDTRTKVSVEGTWIMSEFKREWIEFSSGEAIVRLTPGDSMELELLKTTMKKGESE